MNINITYCYLMFLVPITAKTTPLLGSSKTLIRLMPKAPTFADIASKNGFDCEVYNVTTADGYILGLFRIPGDKKRPVLLMHGILDSADDYIMRQNSSLAITLAREGFDVWAGNNRGNRYSRRHIFLNPDTDAKFWDYSFHEMGFFDLPAIIDFILSSTETSKLSAVGHSEGTTIFYVLGSTRPEYNSKISVLASLASVVYLHHSKGLLPIAMKLALAMNRVIKSMNYHEVFGFNSNLKVVLAKFCGSPVGYEICNEIAISSVFGSDPKQLEYDFTRILLWNFPSGTSRRNLMHYAQVGTTGVFAQFDYGSEKNLEVYGSKNAPVYNLTKVTFNVGLFLGANDLLSTAEDVELLKKKLPHVVEYNVVNYPMWNHIDHIVGKYMPKYLFPKLLKLLRTYS
ncbi:lipase member K-like [Plodia interpunctella]|uniref:lipase member K-like n=1 Tax=Plodia interpunctella TaxID=58824 RepID=UPI00236888BC|nr:lipase member K-like [Plodia interpunctella]